jgi:hypothetical protein
MKRTVCLALAGAFYAMAAAGGVSAQATIVLGGGLSLPTGDYNTYAKPGWLGHAGVDFPVGDAGLSVGAHGFFGSNNHDEAVAGVLAGDKTNLYGGVASVGYAIQTTSSLTPQIFGLAGIMTHAYKSTSGDDSQAAFAAGGGVGIGFPLGSIQGVIEGTYLSGFGKNKDTHIFGVDVGVGIPLGGGGGM